MIFSSPNLALKLTVPAAFFGYAVLANLALFSVPGVALPGYGGLLNGKVSQAIDGLYRENLPHKAPSIGLIGAARYVLLGEGRSGVVVGDNGFLFTSEEFRSVDDAAYAAALGRVDQAAEQLSTEGVQLILAPIPAKLDLMRTDAQDPDASDVLAKLYDKFLTDLTGRGISVVDTRVGLDALPTPFLTTDTHWTPEGARAVANLVAVSGLVPLGTDEVTIETGTETVFSGDLVTYVTSNSLAPLLGLHRESVTPYVATVQTSEDGLVDLFGGDGGGVDLVGTSYSANPNWSFAEALKLELSRDVINHAEEGRGPFDPMVTYLDALDPLALPEAVIWEIPVRYLTDPKLVIAKGVE